MSYLSFARKYRPQIFDEIVGQDHIATTLKNAIAMERVAHAYLFAGPRGVGKTSTARILAKSLNCEKGPTPTPCGKCASCSEISKGACMDVIEIDGASNRGIDEIRNLKESVKYASLGGKFRIYIIDEVHMLTQEAFNALLKTLEEPPLHVKFIFATTRPYKVLPTIISRCQRFDFRKIPIQDIAKKLEEIKKREKLDLGDDAIFLIAKQSDGSMRDAEVILDQLLSFTKGKVAGDDVAKILGLLEQDILFDIADSLLNNEKEKVLSSVNTLIQSGKDPVFVASGIIEHFRNLMVANVAKEKSESLTALSEEDNRKLFEQSHKFSLDEILYVIYTLSAATEMMKKTSLSQIPLEIALIRLTERKKLTSIGDVLERLTLIEKRLKSGSFAVTEETPTEPAREKQPIQEEMPTSDTVPYRTEKKISEIGEEEVAAEKDILLLQKIKNSWAKILNFIKQKKMSVATFLSDGEPLKMRENILSVGFGKESLFHKEQLETDANKKFVEEAIKNIVGEDVLLRVEGMEKKVGQKPDEAAVEEIVDEDIASADAKNPNTIDPIVESALGIFDGKIVDIRKGKPKETR